MAAFCTLEKSGSQLVGYLALPNDRCELISLKAVGVWGGGGGWGVRFAGA